MNNNYKKALKIIGLIALLILLFFLESIVFLMIFGEGGQASTLMNNVWVKFVLYILPIVIVGVTSNYLFKKKDK